jgi:hypothetical protein
MRKIAIGLLAGAGALLTSSANATDVYSENERRHCVSRQR